MKKTRGFKARRQTILIVAMVLLTIFLTNFVSSWDWDNVKSYNSSTKTATITNALGIGSTIATVQLKSNPTQQVGLGYQKVFEYEIDNKENYDTFIQELEIYNLKNKGLKENKKIDLKYLTYENVSIEDFDYDCLIDEKTKMVVSDSCKYRVLGSHIELREKWNDLTSMNIKAEKIVISGWTDVKQGDYYEWIPNFAGVKVSEWATWSGNLSVGLLSYWKLDSNTTEDTMGANNGTNVGATNVTGKIQYAKDFEADTSSQLINLGSGTIAMADTNFTINGWMNLESCAYGRWIIGGGATNSWATYMQNTCKLIFGKVGVTEKTFSDTIATGRWTMFTYTYDTSANVMYTYLNGTVDSSGAYSYSQTFSPDTYYIGAQASSNWFDGILDEIGVWTRVLSTTEITLLYNNYSGCQVNNETCFGPLADASPTITLNSPADASTSNNYANTFTCTGTDNSKVQNISFYINGSLNQTNTSVFNNTATTFSTSLAEGYYNWSCKVWDNATIPQSATSTRTLTITISSPTVALYSPTDTYNSTDNDMTFICNASDGYGVQNVSLLINGTYNQTNTSGFNNTNYTFNVPLADGYYNWSCNAKNINSKSTTATPRNFNIDTISPTINLVSGNGTQTFGKLATNHTLTYIITDVNLNSCWINYNGVNTSIPCTSGILNTTNFSLTYGIYSARLWANDTFGLTTSFPFTWSYEFFYISESYTPTLLEGTNNTFIINLVSGNTLTIGNLSYDNSANLGIINNTGNNYTIIKSMFSPLVSTDTNFTFFWNVTKSNGVYYAFGSHEQKVLNFDIDNCSVNTINIFNLSMEDEETQNSLNASNDNVSIKIDLTLSTLSGIPITTLYKLYNQTLPSEICINDSITGSYLIDGIIEYSASGYAHEFYNLQKYNLNSTSNPLQNITLYDLLSADNQPFRIIYRDKSYLPVSDALVQINRKYIDEGAFKIIEVPKTDSYGETIGNLVLNDVIYTFNIIKNGVLLDSFPNVRVVCQTPTISECKLDLNAFSSTTTITNFTKDKDFSYVLITNRTLRTTTALFTIPSGNISTIVLNVSTTDALGTSICSQSITTSGSSSLICTYPAPIGNISLVAKLYRDGSLVGSGNVNLNPSPKDMFNGFSVILALFVLLTLIGVSISDSPVTMVILFMIGVILLTAMNLVANTGFVYGATILFLIISIVLVIIKGGKRQI